MICSVLVSHILSHKLVSGEALIHFLVSSLQSVFISLARACGAYIHLMSISYGLEVDTWNILVLVLFTACITILGWSSGVILVLISALLCTGYHSSSQCCVLWHSLTFFLAKIKILHDSITQQVVLRRYFWHFQYCKVLICTGRLTHNFFPLYQDSPLSTQKLVS